VATPAASLPYCATTSPNLPLFRVEPQTMLEFVVRCGKRKRPIGATPLRLWSRRSRK
jgi:hypothetical protein